MKFDKGIPAPEPLTGLFVKGSSKYGFDEMEVGDSLFIGGANHSSKASYAARKFSQRNEKKLIARRENDGLRIWRIE